MTEQQEKITIEEFKSLSLPNKKKTSFSSLDCFNEAELSCVLDEVGGDVKDISEIYSLDFYFSELSKKIKGNVLNILDAAEIKFKKDNERRWTKDYSPQQIQGFPLRSLAELIKNSKAREAFIGLEQKGIQTIGDLSRCSKSFLLRCDSFGNSLILDLQALIEPWGIALASENAEEKILNKKAAELEKMIKDMKKGGVTSKTAKVIGKLEEVIAEIDDVALPSKKDKKST